MQNTRKSVVGRLRRKLMYKLDRWDSGLMTTGANYLDAYGWGRSKEVALPVDRYDHPIPWITYPAFSVLRRIVAPEHRVFEYGAGNSSFWFAEHTSEVVSVDHDRAWTERVSLKAPTNLTVRFFGEDAEPIRSNAAINEFFARSPDLPCTGNAKRDREHGFVCNSYTRYAAEITKHAPFDIIVVDGAARSLCAWMAGHSLTPDGIVIFDNSERWQYNAGFLALEELGFGRIDFFGIAPASTYVSCTSIFFRTTKWTKALMTVDKTTSPI
jgi:hypothetical protein